jgi:radical SAM superfamily enzyme YgiQ (UPF0313 family)
VLFVTHLQARRDTGNLDVYRPLRLEVNGLPGTLPVLRILAAGGDIERALRELAARHAVAAGPPVLTPVYLHDYLARRGISFRELPCIEGPGAEPLLAEALRDGVRLVALCTTWLLGPEGAEAVRRAAAMVRSLAPGVPIVAGGVGVRKSLRARELFLAGRTPGITADELARDFLLIDPARDRGLDALVLSEGSEADLAAMVEQVRAGRSFADLPNLALPGPDGYRFTASAPRLTELDTELVDWSGHAARLDGFEAPVRTAVGCPFRCEFCDFAGLYQPRGRSLDSLVAELRTLPAPRRVFFTDDNLGVTRRRLVDFARRLVREGLGLRWRAFLRADTIDGETAALLRDSGCCECLLGIESADPQVLAAMNKRLDPERARNAIERLDAEEIRTQCTFVVGFPGECAASIERTAAFLSALPAARRARAFHRYYLFRFQVSPLCPAARPEQRARFRLAGLGEQWAHATMDAEEARAAIRELFLKVRGPTHMYLEMVPPEWSMASARRVLEARDALQKRRLCGGVEAGGTAALLGIVREADAAG